ncbi:MAG: hypothetical protein LBM08_02875, partial [Dysgonamonadaceae bacterium]|nr:hypothetical protein [Dysgonamonadaceae bacterium]
MNNKTHCKLSYFILFGLLWSVLLPLQSRTPGLYKSGADYQHSSSGLSGSENRSASVLNEPSILKGSTPSGLFSSEKSTLTERPEGNGIALGTPVGEANLLLAVCIILYGLFIKYKKSFKISKKRSPMKRLLKTHHAPTFVFLLTSVCLSFTGNVHAQVLNWGTGEETSSAGNIQVGSSERSYVEFCFYVNQAAGISNMVVDVVLPYTNEAFDLSTVQSMKGLELGTPTLQADNRTLRFPTVANVAQNTVIHYRVARYSRTQPNTYYNPANAYNVTLNVRGGNITQVTKTLPFYYRYAKLQLIDPANIPATQTPGLQMNFGNNHGGETPNPSSLKFQFRLQCTDGAVDSASIVFSYLHDAIRWENWRIDGRPIPADQITTAPVNESTSCTVKIRKEDFPLGNGIAAGESVPITVDVVKAGCGSLRVDYLTTWTVPATNTNIKTQADVSSHASAIAPVTPITFTASPGSGLKPILEYVTEVKGVSSGIEFIYDSTGKRCEDGSLSEVAIRIANTGAGEARNVRVQIAQLQFSILDTSTINIKIGKNTPVWERPQLITVTDRIGTGMATNPIYHSMPRVAAIDISQPIPDGDTLYISCQYRALCDLFIYQPNVSNPGLYYHNVGTSSTVLYYTDACGENAVINGAISGNRYPPGAAYIRIHSYNTLLSFEEADQTKTYSMRINDGHLSATSVSATDSCKNVFQLKLPPGIELATETKTDIKAYKFEADPTQTDWPVRSLTKDVITGDTTVYTFALHKIDQKTTSNTTFYNDYNIEIQLKNACLDGVTSGTSTGEIRMFVYPAANDSNAGCLDVMFDGIQVYPSFSYVCQKEGLTYTFNTQRRTIGLTDANNDGIADIPVSPADPASINHNLWLMGDSIRFTWTGTVLSEGNKTLYAVLFSQLNVDWLSLLGDAKVLTLNENTGDLQASCINKIYPAGNTYADYAMPRDRGSSVPQERYAYIWEITKNDGEAFTLDDVVVFAVDAVIFRNYSNGANTASSISNWFYATATSLLDGLTTGTTDDNYNTRLGAILDPGQARKGTEKYPAQFDVFKSYVEIYNPTGSEYKFSFTGVQNKTSTAIRMFQTQPASSKYAMLNEYRHLGMADSIVIEVPEGYEISNSLPFSLYYWKPNGTSDIMGTEKSITASSTHLNLPHRKVFVFGSEVFDVNHTGDASKWHLPSFYYFLRTTLSISSTNSSPVGQHPGYITLYSDNHSYIQGIPIPRMGQKSADVDYTDKTNGTSHLLLTYADPGSVKATVSGAAEREALSSRINWDINLQNTATNATAYGAWLYVQGAVRNISFTIDGVPCDTEGEDGRWIKLPALAPNGVVTLGVLSVESTSTDCEGSQTVSLYPFYDRAQVAGSTWKPSDVNINMTNTGFATAQIDPDLREYLYSRQTLGIRSVPSRLAGSIRPLAETPASPLHTTGTLYGKTSIAVNEEFPLEINLSTIGAGGPVVDTKVHLNIPAGLEVVTDSAYIEINGTNYRITAENGSALLNSLAKLNGPSSMKTITLNLSDLDLPALGGSAGELPGQTNNYLRLKFKPNCNVSTSAMRMEASLSGKRPCGTDLSTATFYSMYITLSGVTASLQVAVAVPTVATNRFNCHQSDTLRVSFRKTGAQTVSVTGTDSLFIIIPRSLHLVGATPIRYALPAGSVGSTVTAQFGTIALGNIVERAYDADTRIISWAMPKEYFDALSDAQGSGFGSTGSVQSEYNQYGICIGMDEPEVYFEGAIQVGVITGASKGGNCSITSGLTNIQTVDVITSAPNTVWTGSTADWNLSSNWTNGVPGACTDAEIPASSTVFPVLLDTTIRVNSVYLPAGAEIGGVPYLNYDSARVDLSITSNRWYLLSSPFMDMYSGDYILGSTRNNPAVYIRRYQSEDLWSGAARKAASWTSSFGQTNILLTPGTGYAVWVATDVNESQTFDFPKDSTSYA